MALIPCKECGASISAEANACPKCGCPSQISKSQEKKSGCSIGCLFLIIGAIVFIIIMLALAGGGGGGGSSGRDDHFDAYFTAKSSFVPAELKAPSTAKFCEYNDCTVAVDGDIFIVSGWFDAQNSFGAMIRQKFVCKMRLDEAAGKWIPLGTTFSEN